MRLFFKRPKIKDVSSELDSIFEVMQSDFFVYIDLIVFSLLFSLMLSPVLHSLKMDLIFFASTYLVFAGSYFFFFSSRGKPFKLFDE